MKRIFTSLALVAVMLPAMAQRLTVTSSRYVAQGTGNLTIHYEGAPVGTDAWVGIYKSSDHKHARNSFKWAYTTAASGDLTFDLPDWDAYYAVLFSDGGDNEIARSEYVRACNDYYGAQAEAFTMTTDKQTYKTGEPINITYAGAPAFGKDWIALYSADNYPGLQGNSESYCYINGNTSGTVTLNVEGNENFSGTIAPGNYYVTYCLWDGYAEVFARVPFTVSDQATAISSLPGQSDAAAIYNLAGQRLTKAPKGISIIGGKKLLR